MKTAPLTHYNERPAGIAIDTIVIHSMYAPQSPDPYCSRLCAELLDSLQVSAHYIIDKDGDVTLCVDPHKRAWHAGASKMPFPDDSRENVNDFSLGIELVGRQTEPFTDKQYQALAELIPHLASMYPIRSIVGHQHIAPDRKADPGAFFDWKKLRSYIGSNFRFPVAI